MTSIGGFLEARMRTSKHCDKPFSKSVIKSYQLRNLAIANACNRNNIQRDLMSLPRHANYFRTRHFDQSNYRRSTIAVRSADWHPAIADWSLDLQVTQGFLKTYQKNIFSSSIVTIISSKVLASLQSMSYNVSTMISPRKLLHHGFIQTV